MDPYIKKAYLPLVRQHCRAGARWAHELATDYWLQPSPGLDQAGAASTATGDELAENGWTATSLVNTAGSGADFGSSSDVGVPNHFLTNADADLLDSPALFGSYGHMYQVSKQVAMLTLPRYLVAEFEGALTVHSAAELDSGWGFIEDGGSPATEADAMAFIYSDITNFALQCNGALVDLGSADDAAWHIFKISLDRTLGKFNWYIDGTLQNAVGGVGTITTDEFPVSFGFAAGVTNRPGLGLTHVYYDW